MKQLYIVMFFLLSLNLVNGQGNSSKKYVEQLNFKPLIDNFLYVSETEISNRQYHEFIDWVLKNEGRKAYYNIHPDTTVWRDKLSYNEPFVNYYFQHPAYLDFPVVGVSWEQSLAYCNWKAARIMESSAFKKSNIQSIILRLPTEQEWMKAARGSISSSAIYPWEGDGIRITKGRKKDEGKIQLNCKRDAGDMSPTLNDAGGFITTPVESYWPNSIGIYNICGNVNEWISTKNQAKGGSWNSQPYNCRIDILPEHLATNASATIGFRPVLEILEYKNTNTEISHTLTARMIENQVKMINDTLGAAIYETTNQLYRMYLSETSYKEDSVHSKNWKQYSPYAYLEQYHNLADFNAYPVVNITYEAAQHFCEWLTQRYHESNKGTYKKVIFRLPTSKEWEMAASGNHSDYIYPWGGAYFRNSRGNYLANFCPLEEQYFFTDSTGKSYYNYPQNDPSISRGVDGAIFTSKANSYFPNSLGLYQCTGNVAEMTSEIGITKGGSWNTSQYFLTIASHDNYSNTDATIGFRFFMEVQQK